MYLKRIVDDEITDLISGLAALCLEGAKGVGKTETAKRMAKTVFELDNPIIQELAKADLARLMAAEKPILFDEWQQLPQIWNLVRRAVDHESFPGQFLLTGSANPSNPPTHSGAGRVVTLRMRPMSLAERQIEAPTVSLKYLLQGKMEAINGTTSIALDSYVREILVSGFPGIRALMGRAHRAMLGSYVDRIIDRDFRDQGLALRNPEGLRRWMKAYAAATATTTSFETIRDAATAGEGQKPAKSTIQPYREVLERLWILDPISAWLPQHNLLNELSQPPKHHLADPALAASLLGLDATSLLSGDQGSVVIPKQGSILGHLFESLVTLSIRVYAQASEAKVKHLRTKKGHHEIDLIVERADGGILAIEVKLAANIEDEDVKHLHWLREKIGPQLIDAIIIYTGPLAFRRQDGIAVIPAVLLGP